MLFFEHMAWYLISIYIIIYCSPIISLSKWPHTVFILPLTKHVGNIFSEIDFVPLPGIMEEWLNNRNTVPGNREMVVRCLANQEVICQIRWMSQAQEHVTLPAEPAWYPLLVLLLNKQLWTEGWHVIIDAGSPSRESWRYVLSVSWSYNLTCPALFSRFINATLEESRWYICFQHCSVSLG